MHKPSLEDLQVTQTNLEWLLENRPVKQNWKWWWWWWSW